MAVAGIQDRQRLSILLDSVLLRRAIVLSLSAIGFRRLINIQCQIENVCAGYNAAMTFLERKGIDISKVIVSGPSAGAHLASILCYSRKVQECAEIDASHIAGFIGVGGPYSFSGKQTLAVKMLLHQLFEKGYDRTQGEPLSLMDESDIPMLLIQSQHDGLIAYSCARGFLFKSEAAWALIVSFIQ